ncbi:MAG: peptidylprolyl isomerase [Bacteroidota bacterium]|nr:peptidylprolyl isomerase [Bacteroidota bacterium]
MKLTWLFSIVFIYANFYSQEIDILTINGNKVYKSEFEQIYWKNKKEKLATKEDLDEYIDLFINFKLKVLAAEKLGLDTMNKFINELNGYKIQLEKPYLIDTAINEALIKEAYFRTINEIEASHIMIKVSPTSSPLDTLKAWRTIDSISKALANTKSSFGELAEELSHCPSGKMDKGNLGYFNAFKMVYPFENAAYNTAIGKVSPIVRTRFGYHLVKPHNLRKAKGRVKAAHIMIVCDSKKQSDCNNAKEKIDAIYSSIINGGSFEEIAKESSNDRKSAQKGGELGWISSGGNVYPSFENAVFNLIANNEISKPFQTPNGWHIVKRLDFEDVKSYEDLRYELKNKIQKDARAQKTRSSFINSLKITYALKETFDPKTVQNILANKYFDSIEIRKNTRPKSIDKVIVDFTENQFTYKDFIVFLSNTSKQLGKYKTDVKLISEKYNQFLNLNLIEYEKTQLPLKYPDFKALLKEYRDGILLFDISDQMIWSKAIKDTSGLKLFYEKNQDTWKYPNRAKTEIYTTQDKKTAKKIYKLLSKKIRYDSIQKIVNQDDMNVELNKKTLDEFNDFNMSYNELSEGITKPIKVNEKFIILNVYEKLDSRNKLLNEAEGIIVSAYQNHLEKEWIKKLRSENEITVNYDALYSIKEKPNR